MRNFLVAVSLVLIGVATTSLPLKQPGSLSKPKEDSIASTTQTPFVDKAVARFPTAAFGKAGRVLIATIPDPKLTRLALHFDRWIESLQRAAEACSYTFEVQWIPWTTTQVEYEEPGVLLFRGTNAKDRLAILLAGESPVSGISEKQFQTALELAAGNLAGIIGPSFSGSFESLEKLLAGRQGVAVVGGSATSGKSIENFRKAGFRYSSSTDTDETAADAFDAYLKSRKVLFRKSAVLAEGDTAYGLGDSDKSSIRVTFPRDMSVLRRAYDSDQNLRKSITQTGENSTVVSVTIGKGEEASGGDSVPVQTPNSTAATQELLMHAVAKRLGEDHASIANVLATNTLDIMFLRQYMAAHVPDMHFRILEPDILFVHPPEVYAFQGSLAVSRFPLFIQPGLSRVVAFPSKASEGVYWAARSLIGGGTNNAPPSTDLWLTMVGLDGYWPVARLTTSSGPLHWPVRPTKAFGGLVLLVLAGLFVAVWAIAEGRVAAEGGRAPRRWFADFYFDSGSPLLFARQYHAYCVVLMIVVLLLLLYRPLAALMGDWIYLTSLPALVAFWIVRPGVHAEPFGLDQYWFDSVTTTVDRWFTRLMLAAVTAAAAFFLLGMYLKVWEDSNNHWATLAAYRSMYLGSGVNPTLPLFLGGLSLLTCAWFHFQRFIFASERFVPLELTGFGTLQGPYERVRNILSRYSTPHGSVAGIATAWLVIGIAVGYRSALTIEGQLYDAFIVLLLAACAGLTMLSVCQFLQTWWNLKDFLRGLEGLPIRHVFTKMPRSLGSVALFKSGTRERSYLYLIKCRDCVRLMPPNMPQWIRRNIESSVDALLRRTGADERETGEESVNVQVSMLMANGFLLHHLREEVWGKGESELQGEAAAKDQPPHVALAEEFVALRVLGFIRYATVQLRNLLTFFSTSFILQAMAASSYPFFSQSLSRLYVGVAFVVLSGAIGFVLLQMSRDAILQSLSTDSDGKNQDNAILRQALQSASLPVLAFASTYFPDLGRSIFSWLLPALTSAK